MTLASGSAASVNWRDPPLLRRREMDSEFEVLARRRSIHLNVAIRSRREPKDCGWWVRLREMGDPRTGE